MKELSIEEKAKRYDKALERAKAIYQGSYKPDVAATIAETLGRIFPELKENEDEGIRKALIKFHKSTIDVDGIKGEDIIAWLEKQGKKSSDKIVEKARTEKQRVLLTETDGSANIDWDCRSLQDVKLLLEYGLDYIKKLEKQSEQKTANNAEPKDYSSIDPHFLKTTDKVEPKFEVGDLVVHDMSDGRKVIRQIVNMTNKSYVFDGEDFNIFYFNDLENDYHLWTIQDAKDGDVVVDKSDGTIGIFQSIGHHPDGGSYNDPSYCFLHCRYDDGFFYADFEHGNTIDSDDLIPATKEQRDTLMKAMKDAGYTFDFEKKELNKIVVPIFNIGDTIAKKHNSDIHNFDLFTITDITGGKYWYNDRIICDISEQDEWEICEPIRQKPAWSEEDEKMRQETIDWFEKKCFPYALESENPARESIKWLKSLKERYTWKPSDEQMKVCKEVYADLLSAKGFDIGTVNSELNILEEQLKKPSGE